MRSIPNVGRQQVFCRSKIGFLSLIFKPFDIFSTFDDYIIYKIDETKQSKIYPIITKNNGYKDERSSTERVFCYHSFTLTCTESKVGVSYAHFLARRGVKPQLQY